MTSHRLDRRRGISLIELLATMAAASTVMATAAALVHRSYTFETRSRATLADERTALRLARRFRADVHEASTAMTAAGEPGDTPLVTILGPTGHVAYHRREHGLVRLATSAGMATAREEFLVSRPITWSATSDDGIITLVGLMTSGTHAARPMVEIVAAVTTAAAPGGTP